MIEQIDIPCFSCFVIPEEPIREWDIYLHGYEVAYDMFLMGRTSHIQYRMKKTSAGNFIYHCRSEECSGCSVWYVSDLDVRRMSKLANFFCFKGEEIEFDGIKEKINCFRDTMIYKMLSDSKDKFYCVEGQCDYYDINITIYKYLEKMPDDLACIELDDPLSKLSADAEVYLQGIQRDYHISYKNAYRCLTEDDIWKTAKAALLKDYSGICEECGKKTKNPVLHHVKYVELELFNKDHVKFVCSKCHETKIHRLTEESDG